MLKRKKFIGLLTFLTVLGIILSTLSLGIYNIGKEIDLIYSSPFAVDTHPSIIIDGNEELDTFLSGNGTVGNFSNPYVISDYFIDANHLGSGIEIRNTDKYVILNPL